MGIQLLFCVETNNTATRCIEAGVPPVVLKTWLGHSDIHVTLDTYTDVFDSMNREAAGKFDDYIDAL